MLLTLTKIELTHFKGVKNRTETFNSEVNVISGQNGTGKSTLMNAFIWCLFGKDTLDRKDHNIKPIGEDGQNLYEKPQSSCTLHFLRNGIPLVIKRVYLEKWQKKKGSIEEEFTGHETEFQIDGIPKSKREFDLFVTSLFDETIFKILTNPLFFSKDSKDFTWNQRRAILQSLISIPKDIEVCESLGDISGIDQLKAFIQNGKTIEEIKAHLAMSKKEFLRKKEEIPARIDEINKSIKPISKELDEINLLIEASNFKIKNLYSKYEFLKGQKKEDTKHAELQQLRFEVQRILASKEAFVKNEKEKEKIKIQQYNNSISNQESSISSVESSIIKNANSLSEIEQIINSLQKQKDDLLAVYHEEKAKFYQREDFKPFECPSIEHFACPTCKNPISPESYEIRSKEMENNYINFYNNSQIENEEKFNADKAKKLEQIVKKGASLAEEIKTLKEKKDSVTSVIEQLNKEIVSQKNVLSELKNNPFIPDKIETDSFDEEIKKTQLKIELIEEEKADDSISNLENDLSIYSKMIEEAEKEKKDLESLLLDFKFNESLLERKDTLNNEVSFVNSELLKLEALEYARNQFIKRGAELIDEKVNSLFDNSIKFRLFDTQVNGQQVETCKVLVDGVPFDSANTAGQINSGLKIIDTLSTHFKMSLPVWIDNAESVTTLHRTFSQQILLKVSE